MSDTAAPLWVIAWVIVVAAVMLFWFVFIPYTGRLEQNRQACIHHGQTWHNVDKYCEVK